MTSAVLSNMLWLPLECLSSDEMREAKALLTITPEAFDKGGDEETKPIETYVVDKVNRRLGVPAFWGIRLCRNRGIPIIKETATAAPIKVRKCPKPWEEMVPGQGEFFEGTLAALQERNFVLAEAGMGTGKTPTTCFCIYHLKTATTIEVPTVSAADHWREELIKHNGFKPDEIGMIGDGQCRWEGCPVVVILLNSAASKELPEEFFNSYPFTVYDEAHRLGARMFSLSLQRFKGEYRLALTGTPDRKDGCMVIVTNALGKPSSILGGESMPCDVRTQFYHRRFWGRTNPNDLPLSVLVNILSKDTERNALLARRIAQLRQKNRHVLGIGDRIEQLSVIRDMLIEKHNFKPEEVGIFANERVGSEGKRIKIDEDERARVRRDCTVILATRGLMKESVDIPRLDAGLELTPVADAAQEIGRIRRPKVDKRVPLWVTTLDEGVPMLKHFHSKRLRIWKELNCTILDS